MLTITREEIEILLDTTDSRDFVVSAYADLSVKNGFERHVEQHLKNQARAAGKVLADTAAGRALEENLAIIREAVRELDDPRARGLAVFASTARGLRRVIPLDFPVSNQLVIDPEPYVLPLLEHWYAEPTFLVLTIDADEAHLFEMLHGPLDRVRDIVREDADEAFQRDKPRFTYKKRFAQTRHERLHGLLDDKFFKDVARAVGQHWSEGHFDGLVLLGHAHVTGPFRTLLSRDLDAAVAGEAPHAMNGRPDVLGEEVGRVIERFRAGREHELLEELRQRLERQHLAAEGATDVLDALQQGRATRVFLGNARDLPGARCVGCGYRLGAPAGTCPYCGEITRAVNAIQEVMRLAMRHRVPVTICRRASDRDDPIAPRGGVAALLAAPPNWAAAGDTPADAPGPADH